MKRGISGESGSYPEYENLAIAIIQQAIADYLYLHEKKKNCIDRYEKRFINGQIKDIEQFFESQWFDTLSFGKGDYILSKMRKTYKDILCPSEET